MKKGKTAPALKPRAYGSAPAGEDKGDKKGPKQEKKDSKRPLFLVALLAITAAGFLVPWNPLSPFSEGKRNEPVWKEEGAPLPAGHGAEATAPQPPAADPGQPSGAAPEPLDAAEKGGPEPRIKTVAGLLQQLRTVPLHVSREPRGLFIDRVFYPLDSVIEPETGLRLISLQPDIRRPVAVFLTPDGQPHSLPLPENRP
ncbi:MAG: hypothetical protein GVY10_09530 [Verrucomicrobia bacterium]|nr:hypothetical protein [Verrucomicrobiota bacterium]